MKAPSDLVELGVVRGAYGVRGWVRVEPHADGGVLRQSSRWWLGGLGDAGNKEYRPLTLEASRRHGRHIVAKWGGCDDKEAADAMKGATVSVARSSFPPLPPGEHYWVDLLGSRVFNRAGQPLGVVTGQRVSEAGGVERTWLEVRDGADTLLIPLVAAYVDEVDPAARIVRVDWERGW